MVKVNNVDPKIAFASTEHYRQLFKTWATFKGGRRKASNDLHRSALEEVVDS